MIEGRTILRFVSGCGKAFAGGLIPFKINELTKAVNPIKLREYLAAGLPVVSTPLPEVVACCGDQQTVNGPDAAVAAIERAIAPGFSNRAELSGTMAGETWPAKVMSIGERLASVRPRTMEGRPR